MIEPGRVEEILQKLRPAAEHEGLDLELAGVAPDGAVELRARRVAAGAPVAFLIKAVEGTFRRYYPEVAAVRLVEYDPGPSEVRSQSTRLEDTGFAPLARHKPPPLPTPRGIPAVDLGGLDRKHAVRALEHFVDLWGPRELDRLKVIGLSQDAPGRAVKKWLHVYGDRVQSSHLDEDNPDVLVLHLQQACQDAACSHGLEVERMPGKILLIDGPGEPGPADED